MEGQNRSYTDDDIRIMFRDFVSGMEDMERHSKSACEEVNAFESFVKDEFGNDLIKKDMAFDMMMSVAVEYEEDGFVAGVKWALEHLK